uniref:G_PROTEIN_RECEP_F3_4 domain-containing protein n=1 Tax=Parastrongyloides trichosuri TaxID=131310 RepID=A0A0N4ZRV5_PARTI
MLFIVFIIVPIYGIYLLVKISNSKGFKKRNLEKLDISISLTMAGIFFTFSLLFTFEWFRFKTYKKIIAQILLSSLFSFILYLTNVILLHKNNKISVIKDNKNLKSSSSLNSRRSNLLYQSNAIDTYRDFIDPYCTLSFDRRHENNHYVSNPHIPYFDEGKNLTMYSTEEIISKNIPLTKREEQRKSINKIIYFNDLGRSSIALDVI